MSDLVTDIVLRCGTATAEQLRDIYRREIVRPIFTEDEREILMRAFDARATQLNAESMGLALPRWRGGMAK